jgi:hypothetical protein
MRGEWKSEWRDFDDAGVLARLVLGSLRHYIEVDAFMPYARAEMIFYTQSFVAFPPSLMRPFVHSASATYK